MLLAATNSQRSIALLVGFVAVVAWVVYLFGDIRKARPEIGSEVELSPNRKPYLDDEQLETKRLDTALGAALVGILVVSIGLPLYWLNEPHRQEGEIVRIDEEFVGRGATMFATTAEGGFNCAGCHGGMGASGGVVQYFLTDPVTKQIQEVQWSAPALDTVLKRFDESELLDVLTYGRPGTPMPAWGLKGKGPLNDQQLGNLVAYIKTIQISDDEQRKAATKAAEDAVKNGDAGSLGEAAFNQNCARCHTPGYSYDQAGPAGSGAFGPNLTGGSTIRQFPAEADHTLFIENGSVRGEGYGARGIGSGRMPGFSQMLDPELIKAIVEYERSL